MSFPDTWGEGTALVTITAPNGSNVEFASAVTSIDFDIGDKEFESIATIRGGRIRKQTPEEDTIITFEGYPVNLDTTSTDVFQRFLSKYVHQGAVRWDTTPPLSVTNANLNRENFRVVVLFTENTTVTSATGTTPIGSEALRFQFGRCQLVSVKPSFTDNELKFTFKFKCSPYKADGTANYTIESSAGATLQTLEALGAYAG